MMQKKYFAALICSATLAVTTAGPSLSQQALSIAAPPLKDDAPKRPQEGKVEANDFVWNSSPWEKYFRNGENALEDRRFDHAEQMLLKSIKEAKGAGTSTKNLTHSRMALAELYLKQHRYSEAHSLYESTLTKAQLNFGANSEEAAKCLYGLAYTEVKADKEKLAKEHAEAAIRILKDTEKTDTQLFGLCLHTMALIMAKHGWSDDAKPLCVMSRKILERHPGTRRLDLSELLREQSLFFHTLGDRHTAHDLYESSYQIREKAVSPTQPPSVVGEVRFEWEPGSTRAQEIIDNDFPFRYMSAHGIRVACTIIDLWELLAILVTVTNVGDHQEEFELGRIVLERAGHGTIQTQNKEIPTVDPNRIDRIQKERNMWDLTHTRPWLANIQKTRTVRGLVPPNGHDLFMGPNVFGVYGEWKAISHIVPERVGVLPSREGLVVAESTAVDLPGLVRPSKAKLVGLTPVWLEPFESRTGEQFYLYPRDAEITIKIPIGNAVFEFPFHTRKFKLPRSI